jgi:hypothetical protein
MHVLGFFPIGWMSVDVEILSGIPVCLFPVLVLLGTPDPQPRSALHPQTKKQTTHAQMVDMAATTAHNPIKTEFMETFNAIYNPPPPPLMPLSAGEGGAEDDDLDIDAFDALPPLEDCFLPPDLLEDGALVDGMGGGAGGDDWDFGAALDFIFDKEKEGGGGVPAPTTDSEWFGGGGGRGRGGGGGNPPAPGHDRSASCSSAAAAAAAAAMAASGAGGNTSPNAGAGALPRGGKMLAPSSSAAAASQQGESPIRFMYEDALQRLRFEEFVKGFLSMSVFHTAECWVARGADTLEQVWWPGLVCAGMRVRACVHG